MSSQPDTKVDASFPEATAEFEALCLRITDLIKSWSAADEPVVVDGMLVEVRTLLLALADISESAIREGADSGCPARSQFISQLTDLMLPAAIMPLRETWTPILKDEDRSEFKSRYFTLAGCVSTWLVSFGKALLISDIIRIQSCLGLGAEAEVLKNTKKAATYIKEMAELTPIDWTILEPARVRLIHSASTHLEHAAMFAENQFRGASVRVDNLSSVFRVDEIVQLAARTDTMQAKYGAKRVEQLFESQVGAVIASLGFHVTSERPGIPVVDHICAPHDARVPTLFLLDAKSSSRPYYLPRDDRRAIVDYLNTFRRRWPDAHAVEFFLIVGPSAAKTLEAKLKELSAEAGVPVHFCSAVSLWVVRLAFPGPLPVREFYDAIKAGPHVLPDDFIAPVERHFRQVWDAQARLTQLHLGMTS